MSKQAAEFPASPRARVRVRLDAGRNRAVSAHTLASLLRPFTGSTVRDFVTTMEGMKTFTGPDTFVLPVPPRRVLSESEFTVETDPEENIEDVISALEGLADKHCAVFWEPVSRDLPPPSRTARNPVLRSYSAFLARLAAAYK